STPTPEEGDQDAPTEASLFSQQFHPCEAFTEEQLQKAGLGKQSNAAENPESVVRSCGFGVVDGAEQRGAYLVATDRLGRQQVNQLELKPTDWASAAVDGIYVHSKANESADCIAAYDFEWGRFMVHYGAFGYEGKSHDLCDRPVDVLESLILQAGGIHGT
ncbi:MAG: DUF3558 domain-containing protein, partial [Corynebacterium sp.]|nr:DUF3558 domain-containing protein [Corynebacterium sp.]